jgi:hypothetical protein
MSNLYNIIAKPIESAMRQQYPNSPEDVIERGVRARINDLPLNTLLQEISRAVEVIITHPTVNIRKGIQF